jgi:hypothetical protein
MIDKEVNNFRQIIIELERKIKERDSKIVKLIFIKDFTLKNY